MFIYTLKFDKKKAVFAVVVAALLIVGIILLVGALHKRAEAETGISSAAAEEISDLVKTRKRGCVIWRNTAGRFRRRRRARARW